VFKQLIQQYVLDRPFILGQRAERIIHLYKLIRGLAVELPLLHASDQQRWPQTFRKGSISLLPAKRAKASLSGIRTDASWLDLLVMGEVTQEQYLDANFAPIEHIPGRCQSMTTRYGAPQSTPCSNSSSSGCKQSKCKNCCRGPCPVKGHYKTNSPMY
jgi:hypothetical protein